MTTSYYILQCLTYSPSKIRCTIMYCIHAPGPVFTTLHFFITYELAQLARVLHYNRVEVLVRDKHSRLLEPFVSYAKNEVLWIRTVIRTLKHWRHTFRFVSSAKSRTCDGRRRWTWSHATATASATNARRFFRSQTQRKSKKTYLFFCKCDFNFSLRLGANVIKLFAAVSYDFS